MSSTIAELGAAIIRETDARLGTRSADEAMHLFSNTTWAYAGTTFVPNEKFWLQPIRRQLTGAHMHVSGYWYQSYGVIPITRMHALSCAHNGPQYGLTVKYVNVDGTVFETTLSQWVNDTNWVTANLGRTSNPLNTPATYPDLSVYRFADELPEWVNLMPIAPLGLTIAACAAVGQTIPTIAVSQGVPDEHYEPTRVDTWDTTGRAWTPHNRKVYINNDWRGTAQRSAFSHIPTIGDSGSMVCILVNGTLYLYQVMLYSGGYGIEVAPQVDYVNSLIARAQVLADDDTEYTIAVSAMPTLNDAPKTFTPYGHRANHS